ncbi:hypothetical protein [Shouchella lonarensis]|uniref:Uncharacterized protein n=1 Tax=Shouchella lonarensis TaxID=1464122 RepID=A0A1G6GMI0_9BACI|nr:hypothetical protein [Shouchella lonarensis]SDB82386.1 hypothetical protein SAMN05421737_101177 [Shouchella lonarensis]
MKSYQKMLVGFKDEDFNCYASRGDWLYVASKTDTKKGLFRLSRDHHYFVTLTEKRLPAEFGVVKCLEKPITALELARKDFDSREMDHQHITRAVLEEYDSFLIKVNAHPEHTPMATTWLEKLNKGLRKERMLQVHKVFFRHLSKQEKDELLGGRQAKFN